MSIGVVQHIPNSNERERKRNAHKLPYFSHSQETTKFICRFQIFTTIITDSVAITLLQHAFNGFRIVETRYVRRDNRFCGPRLPCSKLSVRHIGGCSTGRSYFDKENIASKPLIALKLIIDDGLYTKKRKSKHSIVLILH